MAALFGREIDFSWAALLSSRLKLMVSITLAMGSVNSVYYVSDCFFPYIIVFSLGMKRNLMLTLAVLITIFLITNSVRKILSFQSTVQQVSSEEAKLEKLRRENEDLKRELEYKKSQRFAEEEIRNKLGLVREGEEVFVIPRERDEDEYEAIRESRGNLPNWKKWQRLIFGDS